MQNDTKGDPSQRRITNDQQIIHGFVIEFDRTDSDEQLEEIKEQYQTNEGSAILILIVNREPKRDEDFQDQSENVDSGFWSGPWN